MSDISTHVKVADDALMFSPPPPDYDTWKNITISYKAAGGDLETFLSWSASDPDNYDEAVARKLFLSVSESGGITPRTLYWYARQHGWQGNVPPSSPEPESPGSQAPPPRLELGPVEQTIAQVEALFRPGEYVCLVVRAKFDAKHQKWSPAETGTCYPRDELIERLRQPDRGGVLEGCNPDAGAWLSQNPTDGTGRGKAKTVCYRHALIESDDIAVEEQVKIMLELGLPISAMTTSGGKSVHALVRVDADGPNHYAERVALLHEACNAAGLNVDHTTTDCGRLTRLAGVMRGANQQRLLYTNVGSTDFGRWITGHRVRPKQDDGGQGTSLTFEALFTPMPKEPLELPPVLIQNTLRKRGIMLVGAAPKVGKTFLAAQMVIAFATGTKLLGYEFAKCERILVVNTEMSRAEYVNRIISASRSRETAAEVARHVMIAHTDGLPELTVETISKIVCESGFEPDVILIDPIYPIFLGDENSNADAKKTLAFLKKIASETGAGVIYMHHFSKGAQDLKEARDRVSGAGTLGRNYSAMWSLTELAPSEEQLSSFPDGTAVVRVSTDLRSFERSRKNGNLDFNAVRVNGLFIRDEDGAFDKAPTREAARRAQIPNKNTMKKEMNIEQTRNAIYELLKENDGEPILFDQLHSKVGFGDTTLKNYLAQLDEFQLVKMRVNGAGQNRNHIAYATWRPQSDDELTDLDE